MAPRLRFWLQLLRIMSISDLDETLSTVPLEYTPRKFVDNPRTGHLFVIETDHNALTRKMKEEKSRGLRREISETAETEEVASRLSSLFCREESGEIPSVPAGCGTWASVVRTLDPALGKELYCVPLKKNKAAFSLALVCKKEKQFLIVGLANEMKFPGDTTCTSGTLQVYAVSRRGKLKWSHEVAVKGVPTAMVAFRAGVLVGAGRTLSFCSFTNNRLNQESECECVGNQIISISLYGDSIIVGDLKENLVYLRYKTELNALKVYAQDQDCSFLTTTCMVNSKTIARADKLGNIFLIKLPAGYIDKLPVSSSSSKDLWAKQWLSTYHPQSEIKGAFYVGEMVLSLQKTTLFPGGSEVLLYATLSGTLGVIGKHPSIKDMMYLRHLEKLMQSENPTLCGQDHLTFRSHHHPVKDIVDGDLCEQFENLDPELQKRYAAIMGVIPRNIISRLRDARSRFIF